MARSPGTGATLRTEALLAGKSTSAAASSTQAIIDRHDRHMSINYGRFPVAMVRGQGATLQDADGKRYIDLFAGFGGPLLGQCHPDLIDAINEQATRLWFVGNLVHTEPQTLLAEHIARTGFGGRSFFCHAGADANEAAIKLARLYGREGGRHKVISTLGGFHGRTFGAMSATGQRRVSEGFEPLLPGFTHVAYGDVEAVEAAIDEQTVAVLAEPIQGESGVLVPSDDYWPRLRTLCDKHDLLLIADEVWTGCGRTGKWFGHQHWNIEPDMMALAKGVGGGLAVGVMCVQDRLAGLFDHRKHGGVAHATTLGGNPIAMAVSARLFEVIERDGLVDRAARLGEQTIARLRDLAQAHRVVREVRGKGLFIGIELDMDASTFDNARQIVERCLERGLVVNAAGANVLRLAPPLVVQERELDEGLGILERVLSEA